jgi:preprotein translocase subunit SecF
MAAFPIKLVPADTKIDFIGYRKIAYIFSGLLMLLSVGFFAIQGLNYGIDFKGGILIEVRTPGPANIDGLRAKLSGLGLGEVALQEFGQPTDVLIRIERQPGGEEGQKVAVAKIKETLSQDVASYRRTEFVGPKVGGELIQAGIIAVVLSLLAIMVYVWFRFEWQFSVGAIVALTHDVVSTIGVFSMNEHEFNLATVAAILTIAGYSINDTVVVFDRIRENLRKYKAMPIEELLNLSLNQTLSRTLLTSITTLLALLAIFFFGGAVIQDFAFALIWGVLIGTFSSIFVASPVVMMLNIRESISGGTVGGNETGQETPAE